MLKDPKEINKLAKRLAEVDLIAKHNEGKHIEAWNIAYAFSDLEASFEKFSQDLLRKLLKSNLSDDEIKEVLIEIGEAFRHIIYHIKDSRYFKEFTKGVGEEK